MFPEFHNKTMYNAIVEYSMGQFSARSNDRGQNSDKNLDPSDFDISGKDISKVIHSKTTVKIPVKTLPNKMKEKTIVSVPFQNTKKLGSRNQMEALSSRSNIEVRTKSYNA